jgi:hypothetical protein
MEEEPESQDFNNKDPAEIDSELNSIEQQDSDYIPNTDINNEETADVVEKSEEPESGILKPNGIDNQDYTEKKPLSEEDLERINKYKKFKKVDGSAYRRVNQFLRKHTYITAREWAIARLCSDFSTRGGAEMTFIGENLPELVPFMIDTYSPQAVNQARSSFKRKVRKSGATFFYGALCGFFTADELDDILFESSEIARFLLEIEGTSIDIDDEIEIEDRITEVMRTVAEAASMIRTAAPKDPNNPDNSKESKNSKKDIQKFLLDETEEEDEDSPNDFE